MIVEFIDPVISYAPCAIGTFQEDRECPESSTIFIVDMNITPTKEGTKFQRMPTVSFPQVESFASLG